MYNNNKQGLKVEKERNGKQVLDHWMDVFALIMWLEIWKHCHGGTKNRTSKHSMEGEFD